MSGGNPSGEPASKDLVPASISRRGRWRRALKRTFVTIALVALVYSGFRVYSQYERDAIVRRLEEAGERVRWDAYANAVIRDSETKPGSKELREALAQFAKVRVGRNELLPTSATYKLVAEKNDWRPGVFPEVQRELKSAAPVLTSFRKASKSTVGLITSDGEFREALLKAPATSHLSQISRICALIALERVDALGRGDARKAFECVRTSFDATRMLEGEPLLPTHERRAEVFEYSASQLMHCLGAAAATDEEYRGFDEYLEQCHGPISAAPVVRTETAKRFTVLDDPSLFREAADKYLAKRVFDYDWDKRKEEWQYKSLASSFGRPLLFRVQTDLLREFESSRKLERAAAMDASGVHRPPHDMVMNVLFVSGRADRLDERLDFVDSLNRSSFLARWGLRICRHFDQKKKLPGRLDEVVDSKMPSIQLSAFADKPPIYTPTADGFTLEAGVRMQGRKSLNSTDEVVRVKFLPNRLQSNSKE